jgi:AraC-like DNA-binding protein
VARKLELGLWEADADSYARREKLAAKAKYNATELASMCGVSARHLRRQSRRYLGTAVHAWLNRLRLAEAQKRLLILKQKPKEFVSDLGFKYERDFEEYFKRSTGVTAGKFMALVKSSKRPTNSIGN